MSVALRDRRLTRVKGILARHAGDEFMFSDVKFVLQVALNSQNVRVTTIWFMDSPHKNALKCSSVPETKFKFYFKLQSCKTVLKHVRIIAFCTSKSYLRTVLQLSGLK